MKNSSFLLGLLVGSVSSVLAYQVTQKKVNASPEKSLQRVKSAFQQHYTVTGSWIHLKPETLVREKIETSIYNAGLTVKDEDKIRSFALQLDASTGAVISIYLEK